MDKELRGEQDTNPVPKESPAERIRRKLDRIKKSMRNNKKKKEEDRRKQKVEERNKEEERAEARSLAMGGGAADQGANIDWKPLRMKKKVVEAEDREIEVN